MDVNKLVGVSYCNAPEGKVALTVMMQCSRVWGGSRSLLWVERRGVIAKYYALWHIK